MKKFVTIKFQTLVLLIVGCLLSFILGLNFVHQVAAKEGVDEDDYSYLKNFTDVLALVQRNYVDSVETKQLVDGAIKGMVANLDPHSGYLPPDMYKDLQVETKGEFGGLGIEITVKDKLITVVAPIEDSPAFRAGVKAGDQIIKIGNEFTKDITLVEAVKKMRGPKGTPITISVHREGVKELIPLTVIRDVIKVKSVRSRMLEDGFGYVRLIQFQEGSANEFSAAMKALSEKASDKKLHGLVVDLRNDPGGLLTQAVQVSDIFLKEGIIVYTDGRLESQKQKYFATNDGTEPDYPVIILVNGGSASASEIVAGAMQDHKRALVVGTQSFGKGSVQTILPMDNGAALRLTTALYYTKSGRSIQAQGVTPDIPVSDRRLPKDSEELLEEDETMGPLKEKDLPGALRVPSDAKKLEQNGSNGNSSKPKKNGASHDEPLSVRDAMNMDLKELLRQDPQLDEALKLLKTWHIFQGKPLLQASVAEAPKS